MSILQTHKHISSIFGGILGLSLIAGAVFAAYPNSPVTGVPDGGYFKTYFENLKSNTCNDGQAIAYFEDNPNYLKPVCRSLFWESSGGNGTITYAGNVNIGGSTSILGNTQLGNTNITSLTTSDPNFLGTSIFENIRIRHNTELNSEGTGTTIIHGTLNNDTANIGGINANEVHIGGGMAGFPFSVNGSARIEQNLIVGNGNIGVGTANPTEKLDINGNIKSLGLVLPQGAGAGKVLTSDASGNASWQNQADNNSISDAVIARQGLVLNVGMSAGLQYPRRIKLMFQGNEVKIFGYNQYGLMFTGNASPTNGYIFLHGQTKIILTPYGLEWYDIEPVNSSEALICSGEYSAGGRILFHDYPTTGTYSPSQYESTPTCTPGASGGGDGL